SVDDEILSIKSRSNLIEVVKRLKLNVKITALGDILDSEIYGNLPFEINFIAPDSVIHSSSFDFYIRFTSNTTFAYSDDEDGIFKAFSFGSNIPSDIGDIIITPNLENYNRLKETTFRVQIIPVTALAQGLKARISITPEKKGSTIAGVYLTDAVLQKAKDVIDELILVYNENTVADRKAIADGTSSFINDRINNIYTDLSSVDQSAEDFKSDRKLTDIGSQANINLTAGAESESELQNTQIQMEIASSMTDILDSSQGYEILPSNIGIEDGSINQTTSKYNELVLQRDRLLKSSNENNPIIVNLDQQLNSLKQNLRSSLYSTSNNLNLKANSLSQRLSAINSRLYSTPKNERTLRDITRKQETKEALYLYLLEKREESQIAFASAKPNLKIIDSAYSLTSMPIGLDPNLVYLGFLAFGLFVPFSIIYVHDLLDTKIYNKLDLEKLVEDTPVIGELPKLSRKETKLIKFEDRSVLAEALRILRTNLEYLLQSRRTLHNKGNIIFVTSSVSGEGKTFISSNLTMVFASTKKKVLLIGADIRNPRIHSFFSGKDVDKLGRNIKTDVAGLSEYLLNSKLKSDDVINTMLAHNSEVDVIYSGKIPPNPAELLMSERMGTLFEEVIEKYDYIIVDTAPTLVVTDTLLISKYAHQIIYVTKAGVTEKKVMGYPIKLKKEGKLKNLSFVVNNVSETNLGYGGKYGYGYGRSKMRRRWSLN
ncbi:MAG: polysaccharide biosynthesis tyrosine autokinase, partial [Flavobacteriaceae bacterium]